MHVPMIIIILLLSWACRNNRIVECTIMQCTQQISLLCQTHSDGSLHSYGTCRVFLSIILHVSGIGSMPGALGAGAPIKILS